MQSVKSIQHSGYQTILNVYAISSFWSKTLAEHINNADTEAIHIAFAKDCILNAITRFYVNGEHLSIEKNCYSRETHLKWGLIS